ncbi:sugar phosphate isomerase/epimerase family protein [Desulfonatronum thioautotrophicum]|uniref:sugar phosphate isomerase/epimerase family protein n=1 Tax=Desulfonatronum thioautotrophicum TaxID=617001 RepID=UPI0005EB2C95|nr:TIM barrel protein [Desulfonatronum thioautotrophicum]
MGLKIDRQKSLVPAIDMHGCPLNHFPTLAFTASASDPASRLHWVTEQAEAVEFSPDPDRLDQLPEMVRPFVRAGLRVRFHTRYFEHELGHADPVRAGRSLEAHLRTLRAMDGQGDPVVTVHTGLDPALPVHEPTLMENLARLVEHGRDLGIVVCLENLRLGPSSEPANILHWAETAEAMITLDVGHALGSEAVRSGRCSARGFVELFKNRLHGLHIYGREDEKGHHPIEDIAPFEPLIASLPWTGCTWWTIELQNPAHAEATRRLVRQALVATNATNATGHDRPAGHQIAPLPHRALVPRSLSSLTGPVAKQIHGG